MCVCTYICISLSLKFWTIFMATNCYIAIATNRCFCSFLAYPNFECSLQYNSIIDHHHHIKVYDL